MPGTYTRPTVTVKVHHLNCATMCPRGGSLMGGKGGPLTPSPIVAHCLLVEAGDSLVLVDTGFGTEDVADQKRLGQPFRGLIRPKCDPAEPAVRQMKGLGLDPADVRHIIVTHLDVDHAGGLGDFPEAEVHVFGSELAMAMDPPWRERTRYVPAQWAHGPRWVEHDADGDDWFGFESVRVLEGLGEEIALVPLAGHSAGNVGVAIRKPEAWLLHCGDAYFHRGDIATPRACPPLLRVFQTIVQHDGKARHRNQERLRELHSDHGDEVTLFCSHDPVEFADS